MSCQKCTEKFVLENKPSAIYFITEFDELESKLRKILRELQCTIQETNGLICIQTKNTENFFIEYIETFNVKFNELERNDINFIPTSIYDPEYCLNSTVKWANQLEFDPSQIVFEVVETEFVKDQKHLKKILEYYRSKGFQIALDDVGEGYSSLNMLIELKPDIIKIDRNIIDGIDKNELKQSVYRALFNLAKEHDITVLAEGVETKGELQTINSIGVDLVQGYYFAKPCAEPIRKIL